MDQDQMKSVKVYDPMNKCHYQVLLPKNSREKLIEENVIKEEEIIESRAQGITTWNRTETLALINIFSLFKDKFKDFKKRKEQWNLISEELAKIGIYKVPEKCEIKWKNLLRVYRQHKNGNKGQGKFEFFNELDDIVSNDKQFKFIVEYPSNISKTDKTKSNIETNSRNREREVYNKRPKCSCVKSEKQKRHEDRMAIMTKKMEIEERKVKAFEEYLQFLKSCNQKT